MSFWQALIVAVALGACCVWAWPSDFESFPAAWGNGPIDVATVHNRVDEDSWWDRRTYTAHIATSDRPLREFNVLPPSGGCGNTSTPFEAAVAAGLRCAVVTNGGFFDPNNAPHSCFGLAWNRRRPLFRANVTRLAVFATRRDHKTDTLVIGYLNSTDIDRLRPESLISGQGWLVRRGTSYVDRALQIEDFSVQRSGSGRYFAGLKAPRLAVGHDVNGKLLLVAVDGDEQLGDGVNLWEFATLLIRLGVWNAINLDGGGSVSFAVHDVVVNVPSDRCDSLFFGRVNCVRHVATAVCLGPDLVKPSYTASASTSIDISVSLSARHTTTQRGTASASKTSPMRIPVSRTLRGWIFTCCCLIVIALLSVVKQCGDQRSQPYRVV